MAWLCGGSDHHATLARRGDEGPRGVGGVDRLPGSPAGLSIASNRVEKFNDWSVSARCKHQGMEWTQAGVLALAMLEATRRNGELPAWRAKHSLPAWDAPQGTKKVA